MDTKEMVALFSRALILDQGEVKRFGIVRLNDKGHTAIWAVWSKKLEKQIGGRVKMDLERGMAIVYSRKTPRKIDEIPFSKFVPLGFLGMGEESVLGNGFLVSQYDDKDVIEMLEKTTRGEGICPHHDNSEFIRVSEKYGGKKVIILGFGKVCAVYTKEGVPIEFKVLKPLSFQNCEKPEHQSKPLYDLTEP